MLETERILSMGEERYRSETMAHCFRKQVKGNDLVKTGYPLVQH